MTGRKRERVTVTALPDGLRQCPNCKVWFNPQAPGRRITAIYCDRSCQESARQKR